MLEEVKKQLQSEDTTQEIRHRRKLLYQRGQADKRKRSCYQSQGSWTLCGKWSTTWRGGGGGCPRVAGSSGGAIGKHCLSAET